MPRKPKPLAAYPQWTLDVVGRIIAGENMVQLTVPDRATAQSSAHMFNRARLAMAREWVDDRRRVEITLDIICRVTNLAPQGHEGQYVLEFVPRGLAVLADELKGIKSKYADVQVPGIDDAAQAPMPEAVKKFVQAVTPKSEDKAEEFFENWRKGKEGK